MSQLLIAVLEFYLICYFWNALVGSAQVSESVSE